MKELVEIKENTKHADEFYLESAIGMNKEELAWLIEQSGKIEEITEILHKPDLCNADKFDLIEEIVLGGKHG
ncbi:hypothetical protein HF072_00460 [Bacillus sp. RO3]|nr:hypothetical protein [Bacillus sp. RO3]